MNKPDLLHPEMIRVVGANHPQLSLRGSGRLANLGRHGQRPSGVRDNILHGNAWVKRIEIGFSLRVEPQHTLGGDDGGGAALLEASGGTPGSVAWAGDVMNPLRQTGFFVVQQRYEAPRQRRDIASASTAGQPDPFPVLAKHFSG